MNEKKQQERDSFNSRDSLKAALEKPGQELGKDHTNATGQLCQEKL